MEKAITIAGNNGWCLTTAYVTYKSEEERLDENIKWFSSNKAVLDPLFWKALGKGLGWEDPTPYDLTSGEQEYLGEWVMRWHEFIDHLIEGNDKDSFFTNLIK